MAASDGRDESLEKALAFRLLPLYSGPVNCVLRYRGKNLTVQEVAFIQELIAQNPHLSRRRLSAKLAQAWNWVQPNGTLRDMVCRGLMLALHRAGHIGLPAQRFRPLNPLAQRRKPAPLLDQRWDPIQGTLAQLGEVQIRQVRRTPEEKLFGSLMQAHHYLAYTQPVGEHLKYLIWAQGTPLACLAFSSPPRHLGPRDRFIGWSPTTRRAHLPLLAYNTRFLILPWVRVPCLGSYLLAQVARVISRDWQKLYRHPIYLLETFIDPTRFCGTCYRAANWICLGLTTGRGKDDQTRVPNRSLKQLWVYPLQADFRRRLCAVDHG